MGCSGSKEPGVDGGGAHRARELAVSAKGETRNLTYNMFKKSRGDRFDEVYEVCVCVCVCHFGQDIVELIGFARVSLLE